MTKLREDIKIKADIAAQEAKEQVYKEAKTKKRKVKKDKPDSTSPSTKWVEDPVGNQGKVFFDGYKYWLTEISPKSKKEFRKVSFIGLTPKQWEERTKKGEEINELRQT